MELFCHLIDEKDVFFDNCYCALIASFYHCLENENSNRCRLIGDGDDLLADSLFDYFDPDWIFFHVFDMTYFWLIVIILYPGNPKRYKSFDGNCF